VITELQKLRNERVFEVSVKDITTDSELFERYKNVIPVLVIDGKVRLAGALLANPKTIEGVLRRAVFSMNVEQEPDSKSHFLKKRGE
jgi:hypothetical protein